MNVFSLSVNPKRLWKRIILALKILRPDHTMATMDMFHAEIMFHKLRKLDENYL